MTRLGVEAWQIGDDTVRTVEVFPLLPATNEPRKMNVVLIACELCASGGVSVSGPENEKAPLPEIAAAFGR